MKQKHLLGKWFNCARAFCCSVREGTFSIVFEICEKTNNCLKEKNFYRFVCVEPILSEIILHKHIVDKKSLVWTFVTEFWMNRKEIFWACVPLPHQQRRKKGQYLFSRIGIERIQRKCQTSANCDVFEKKFFDVKKWKPKFCASDFFSGNQLSKITY